MRVTPAKASFCASDTDLRAREQQVPATFCNPSSATLASKRTYTEAATVLQSLVARTGSSPGHPSPEVQSLASDASCEFANPVRAEALDTLGSLGFFWLSGAR